jgi:hypothetical protein
VHTLPVALKLHTAHGSSLIRAPGLASGGVFSTSTTLIFDLFFPPQLDSYAAEKQAIAGSQDCAGAKPEAGLMEGDGDCAGAKPEAGLMEADGTVQVQSLRQI